MNAVSRNKTDDINRKWISRYFRLPSFLKEMLLSVPPLQRELPMEENFLFWFIIPTSIFSLSATQRGLFRSRFLVPFWEGRRMRTSLKRASLEETLRDSFKGHHRGLALVQSSSYPHSLTPSAAGSLRVERRRISHSQSPENLFNGELRQDKLQRALIMNNFNVTNTPFHKQRTV